MFEKTDESILGDTGTVSATRAERITKLSGAAPDRSIHGRSSPRT